MVAFTTDEEVGGENGARVVRDYLLGNGLGPIMLLMLMGSPWSLLIGGGQYSMPGLGLNR